MREAHLQSTFTPYLDRVRLLHSRNHCINSIRHETFIGEWTIRIFVSIHANFQLPILALKNDCIATN